MSDIVSSLKLRRPITVPPKPGSGDLARQVDALDIHLPSGRTVLELGEPFTTKIEYQPGGVTLIEFKIIPALAKQYHAEMTGIAADLLGQLHPLDVIALNTKLSEILRPIEG